MTEKTKTTPVRKPTVRTKKADKTTAPKTAARTPKTSADTTRVQTRKPAVKKVKVPERTKTLSQEQVKQLLAFVRQKLDDGKAENIISIDLAGKTSFADYLVIAGGTSSRHVFGLANNLATDLKKAGYRVQVSGDTGDGNWVVIDVIDIVIHLFTPETRAFYNLEEIWQKNK